MASLSQAKTLGGVGSILVLLLPVPSVGWLLSIIGWILVLVAVKNVADTVGDNKIFNDMLIAAVMVIVGVVVAGVLVFAAFLSFIGFRSTLPTITPGMAVPSDVIALIGEILIGLVVAWVFFLIASIFIKRSYEAIGLKINVGMFHTTGLLFLIGAITTIIGVGFFIVLIAIILQIVAFFSIPDMIQQQPQPTWTPPPTPPPQPA